MLEGRGRRRADFSGGHCIVQIRHCNRVNRSYEGGCYACYDDVGVWISGVQRCGQQVCNKSEYDYDYA